MADLPTIKFDDLDQMAANSFRNFHAKGLDYLCLQRSAALTVKAYFYQAGVSAPELVCPHDHRYPFYTQILAGESGHKRFLIKPEFLTDRPTHQLFHWRTPLLGGQGFEWRNEAEIALQSREEYASGEGYFCRADEVHTISIRRSGTVLLLYQFADVVPLGEPTITLVPGDSKEPPSTDGLYDRMTLEHAENLLGQVRALLPTTPTGKENGCG